MFFYIRARRCFRMVIVLLRNVVNVREDNMRITVRMIRTNGDNSQYVTATRYRFCEVIISIVFVGLIRIRLLILIGSTRTDFYVSVPILR